MKIKVFDTHTDILFDVYTSSLKGDLNRFNNYHLPQLKGNINGGIWTFYSPKEFDLLPVLEVSLKLIDTKGFDVILGLEGLRNLKSIDDMQKIYDLGFRHAMLTWNEENYYATGVKGPKDRGVTEKGYELLDFMISHDIIIDLSHLNEKSFYDVLNYTNKNIICSHSNLKKFCNHDRNLTNDQLHRLKEADALLCLTLVGIFISENDDMKNLDNFLLHIREAINIMGIDNVCFGYDFMDYFNPPKTMNIEEVQNASEINNFLNFLKDSGFSSEEIEKMTYYNFYNRFKRHIVK